MMWVNDTLPPRPRRRWLLMTVRLSMRSFAGIARTLVAVGTARLASMFVTTRAAAPRNGEVAASPVGATAGFAAGFSSAVAAGLAADSGAGALGSTAGGGLGGAGLLSDGPGVRSGLGSGAAVRGAPLVAGPSLGW